MYILSPVCMYVHMLARATVCPAPRSGNDMWLDIQSKKIERDPTQMELFCRNNLPIQCVYHSLPRKTSVWGSGKDWYIFRMPFSMQLPSVLGVAHGKAHVSMHVCRYDLRGMCTCISPKQIHTHGWDSQTRSTDATYLHVHVCARAYVYTSWMRRQKCAVLLPHIEICIHVCARPLCVYLMPDENRQSWMGMHTTHYTHSTDDTRLWFPHTYVYTNCIPNTTLQHTASQCKTLRCITMQHTTQTACPTTHCISLCIPHAQRE